MIAYDKYIAGSGVNYTSYSVGSPPTYSVNRVARRILAGSDLNRKGDRHAATPFMYDYQNIHSQVGSELFERSNYLSQVGLDGYTGTTGYCEVLTPPAPDYDETTQSALNKIYDQIRGSGMLVVDAAEGSQTLRMLRSTLNLKKFVKNFLKELVFPKPKRSGRIGSLTPYQQRLDYATGKWLEYRYGWTPLVSSIYEAADLLYQKEREREVVVKGRSGRVKVFQTLNLGSGTFSDPFVRQQNVVRYRSELSLTFRLKPGLQIYDWTSLNPARIAWELLPLSSVADWVVNISDVLDQFENYWLFRNYFFGGWQSNSSAIDCYKTTSGFTQNNSVWYWPNGTIGPNQTLSSRKSFLAVNQKRYHRRFLLGELPYSNQVRISINIGAKRQLDAAALIHQIIGKKLR